MATGLDTRVCIVGAGAGGLSAAYYLTQQGYQHVTVLESLDRVGGKCHSITYDSCSFDLGANYVTEAYTEVLRLAELAGAEMYTEDPTTTLYIPEQGEPKYTKPLDAVRGKTSLLQFGWATFRYFWERLKLNDIADRPGFGHISQYPELCVSFDEWLVNKRLTELRTLFEVPITIMGYGYLDEVPAPYALKYMSIKTFFNLVIVGLGWPTSWPKRFVDGFQRFWERIATGLDVRLNVGIDRIERDGIIRVFVNASEEPLEFDKLILACPMTLDVLTRFLTLSKKEEELFRLVIINPYCLTSHVDTGLELPERIVGMLPLPELGKPFAITQQFQDNSLVQFYSRMDQEHTITKERVLEGIREYIQRLGGRAGDYHTYNEWPYFPHITAEDMKRGFYSQLEDLQGQQNTFYCGGFLAFELVEPIVNYSKYLIDVHFVNRNI